MIEVSATQMAKNFGQWHDRALSEPVLVTTHQRPSVVLVNASTFERLINNYREVVDLTEMDELMASSIENADIPEEHRWLSSDPWINDDKQGD